MTWFWTAMLICMGLIIATEILWRVGHSFGNPALKSKRLQIHLLLGAVAAYVYGRSFTRVQLGKHDAALVFTVLAMVSVAAGGLLAWMCLCIADHYLSIRSEMNARSRSKESDGESVVDEDVK